MTRLTQKTLIVYAALLVAATPAAAQEGHQILARIDSTLAAPEDMVATQRMTLVDRDGREQGRTLLMYQKGPDLRMARFIEPAEVRDVGFLRLAEDQMYLYLPAFRRVRRIASSIKHEDFMGTDLSYEDLARTRFGDDYVVVAVERSGAGYRLTLEARPTADVSYGRIEMQADGETWLVTQLDLYGVDDTKVKTIVASEIDRIGPYWLARRIVVESADDGHRTVLDFDDVQFDTGIADDFFSQRQLKRGR